MTSTPRASSLRPPRKVFWYGLGKDASVRARRISSSLQGLRFEVTHGSQAFDIESALVGRINVYNILAAPRRR